MNDVIKFNKLTRNQRFTVIRNKCAVTSSSFCARVQCPLRKTDPVSGKMTSDADSGYVCSIIINAVEFEHDSDFVRSKTELALQNLGYPPKLTRKNLVSILNEMSNAPCQSR